MATEWTQEQEQSGEGRALKFGDIVAGEAILYGDGHLYGATVEVWTQESETSPTVTEA